MPAPSPSPATLVASNLSCELGGRLVLDRVSVTVGPDTRLGVVGPNGAGKSTLLQCLAGLVEPDAGRVELTPPSATVGYLAQELDQRADESVRAYLQRITGVARAEEDLHHAAAHLDGGGADATDRYGAALDRWHLLGADDFDARAQSALAELGLAETVRDRPTASLSGGQRSRVALAGILLSRYDVTLLDEPTNDLDFDGLDRLERFVTRRRGGMVVVSHDRQFLDNTVDAVLELDAHDHTAKVYRGGWTAYLEERATARCHAEESFADYHAKRRALLTRARREREWATTGKAKEKRSPRDNDKAQRDFRLNRTEQLAARARRTDRAIARLDAVEKPWEGWNLRFSIGEAPRAGAVVARLDGAVIRRGSFCIGPVDFEVSWGERIALAGPNGSGKTTLVQGLLGRVPLESGRRWLGPSVVVGEIDQDRSTLAGHSDLLTAFMRASVLDTSGARSLLAKFGLGADHVVRPVTSLSPGERTRAELAGLQARGVNFLVLDEPTNHLDLEAVEQLEEALAGYAGTLLVITHDRRLLQSLDVKRTVPLAEYQSQ